METSCGRRGVGGEQIIPPPPVHSVTTPPSLFSSLLLQDVDEEEWRSIIWEIHLKKSCGKLEKMTILDTFFSFHES